MQASLAAGFADPVLDAQAVFRTVMDALARPGTVHALPARLAPPAPLTAELAALALTLADHEAPLWLDARLTAVPDVADYLRFHTGARIVSESQDAAFALIADPAAMPALDNFAQGVQEYPDRSTTLVLALETLSDAGGMTLAGPGIAVEARLSAAPLPADFLVRWRANRALFPCGIDLILTSPGRIAGLPRSTDILAEG